MTALKDKTIWITGASGGIGEALAIQAANAGARLVLSARREAELVRVRAACGGGADRIALLPVDLMAFDAEAVAAQASSFFGGIDVLVNNAGRSQRSLLVDTGMATYRELMELDFFAPVALTKAVLTGMRTRGSGHVVMISSIAGLIGAPLRTGYSAAKFALTGFTEAARAELWREGLRFTSVHPGFVRTQISVNAHAGDGTTFGKVGEDIASGIGAEDCARQVWNAVTADREEVLIGREAAFVRLKRHLPAAFSYALKRAKQKN